MARIWLRATRGRDLALVHSCSHLFPSLCLCADPSLVLTQKGKRRKACVHLLSAAQPIISLSLSLSHSAATRGLSSHFPRGDHLSTHLINRTHFLRVLKLYVHPAQPGCSLSLFYSTTDRKTIDECTSDVTPDPRGTERDLKRRISTLSLKKKKHPKKTEMYKKESGLWCSPSCFILYPSHHFPPINKLNQTPPPNSSLPIII